MAVPVRLGRWTESQESEIALALSETPRMASWDAHSTIRMIERMNSSSESIKRLVSRLESSVGSKENKEGPHLVGARTNPTKSDTGPCPAYTDYLRPMKPDHDPEPVLLSASRVRLISLFLDEEKFERFSRYDEVLQGHHGLRSTSEVVMRVMEDTYRVVLGHKPTTNARSEEPGSPNR